MKKLLLPAFAIAALVAIPAANATPLTPTLWQYNFNGADGETGILILNGFKSGNAVNGIVSGELILDGSTTNVCPNGAPNCVSGAPFSSGTFLLNKSTSISIPSDEPPTYSLDFMNSGDSIESLQFVPPAGATGLYILNDGSTVQLVESGASFRNNNDPITVHTPPTLAPEPSSLALLGTGFLGLALLLFRRKRGSLTEQSKSIA